MRSRIKRLTRSAMRRLGYQPVGHEGGFRSNVLSPFHSLLKTFGFAPKHMDLEYFARIAARFPLVVVESPRIVEYRPHGPIISSRRGAKLISMINLRNYGARSFVMPGFETRS
jgi:hypothetical protein